MNLRKHVSWLYEELPDLVGRGVLTPDAAEKLRQHYGAAEPGGGRRWAMVVFGILGAVLIGAGIILLLAHNWEEFTRPVRTGLSFLPLLLALAVGGYALARQRASTAWCEGAGLFWALSIGASIALVAQTYHISGDFAAFMLTWSLAGLPIVYLLRSSATAMLYWVGITTWAGHMTWGQQHTALWFWPLAALAVPHLWQQARANPYQPRVGWLVWVLGGCGAFGVGFGLTSRWDELWMLAFTGYFATLYLVGSRWFDEGRTFWQRPFQSIGAVGVLVLAVVLTFEDAWHRGWRAWPADVTQWLQLIAVLLWPVVAVGLWGERWRRREPVALLFGALPLVALAGSVLSAVKAEVLTLVLMNLYTFGLGVALIAWGVRQHRLGVVNLGMLVTAALIIARFFDSDLSFVLRGLVFIGIGIGFLVTNFWLLRQARREQ